MKAPITLAVLALHAAVITTILIGCNSTEDAPQVNPELNGEATVAATETGSQEVAEAPEQAQPAAPVAEGSDALRAIPTRPAQNLQSVDQNGFADNNAAANNAANEATLEPLKPAQIKPAQDGEVKGTQYKVKAGDNISKIAKRHGISAVALLDANGMTRTDILKVGQTLTIPEGAKNVEAPKANEAPATAQADTSATSYVVQKGDSLSKIAIKFNTSVKKIMELNGLKKSTIMLGQKLKVPAAGAGHSEATSTTSAPSAKSNAEALKGKRVHKIAQGETLGLIAKKYKVSVAKLMDLNSIKDPRKIRAGQIVIIGDAVTASEAPTATPTTTTSATPKANDTMPKVEPDSANAIKVQPDSPSTIAPTSVPVNNAPVQDKPQVELPEIQEV